MNFRKLILILALSLITPATSPSPSQQRSSNNNDEEDAPPPPRGQQQELPLLLPAVLNPADDDGKKRKRACPGCKEDLSTHTFDLPHRDCIGRSSPQATTITTPSINTPVLTSEGPPPPPSSQGALFVQPPTDFEVHSAHLTNLRQKLATLELEEKAMKAQAEETALLEQIASRQASINRLRSSSTPPTASTINAPPPRTQLMTNRSVPAFTAPTTTEPPSLGFSNYSTPPENPSLAHLLGGFPGNDRSHPPNPPQQTILQQQEAARL